MLAAGHEHGVRDKSETNALVRAGHAGTTEHGIGGRHQVLEVITACTFGVDALDHEAVTSTPRDVLDLQGTLNSPAPLVAGMACGFCT